MIGYIYKITVPTSNGNFFYIGQKKCRKGYEDRIVENYFGSGKIINDWFLSNIGCSASRCKSIKAFEKGIIREILAWANDLNELNKLEADFVNPELNNPNCWNLKEGGNHPKYTKTVCLKISKANKGRIVSEETKKKLSKANKGKVSPNKGKKMSEEQKLKLSIAGKGRQISTETKNKISKSNTGKVRSLESKQKYKNSKLGNKNPRFGKKQTNKQITQLEKYWKNGTYNKGKTLEEIFGNEKTAELKEKFSKLNQGKLYWNDGKQNKFQKDCPGPEWKRGRLPYRVKPKYWTNGKRIVQSQECPGKGWIRGRKRWLINDN